MRFVCDEQVEGPSPERDRERNIRLNQCKEATLRETDVRPLREVR